MLADLATVLEKRLDADGTCDGTAGQSEPPNHQVGGWVVADQAEGDRIGALQAACLFRSDAAELCCKGQRLSPTRQD